MSTQTPSLVRRTFRITVDVETIVTTEPRETLGNGPEDERYHQALVQHLLAHPPALCQLLRSSAVEALLPYFDGYAATIKQFGMTEVGDESARCSLTK